jgi:hypothetical protein
LIQWIKLKRRLPRQGLARQKPTHKKARLNIEAGFLLSQSETSVFETLYFRTNVTFKTTRYSVTSPSVSRTDWSFTQTPETPFSVLLARLMPLSIAS